MLVHIHSSWTFGDATQNKHRHIYGHQMLLAKNVTVLWERRPMVGRNVWVGVHSSTLQFLLSDIFGRHNLKRITSWSRLPFSGKSSQLEPVTWQALWDLNSPSSSSLPPSRWYRVSVICGTRGGGLWPKVGCQLQPGNTQGIAKHRHSVGDNWWHHQVVYIKRLGTYHNKPYRNTTHLRIRSYH